MKKRLFAKLFIALLTGISLLIFAGTCGTKASSIDELNDEEVIEDEIDNDLDVKGKIMKYDARTNETTEVDMEEFKQITALLDGGEQKNDTYVEAYDPYASVYNPHTAFSPRVTSMAQVYDTTTFPNRTTCRLKFTISSGKTGFATGAIVGPNLLLTAAHCVFNEDNNNAVFANWTAYPGYNNSLYKGLYSGWAQVYYSNEWMTGHSYKYDWALCILEKNIGDSTGWMGVQSYGTSAEMKDLKVMTLGYPKNDEIAGYPFQFEARGTIDTAYSNWFKYNANIASGFSGGPVFRESDDYIVGVNSMKYNFFNAGKAWRVDQNMIDLIKRLR